MRKIGIITIHNVCNYGATYQAYGLLHFLNQLPGVRAELIDYTMNKSVVSSTTAPKSNLWNKCVKYFNKALHFKRWFNDKITNKKFQRFWKRRYILSHLKYPSDKELFAHFPQYDLYISGSDQIFNLDLTHQSLGYFLPMDNIRKISYSSSFGMNGITKDYLPQILHYLSSYEAVSVREKSALAILEKQANIHACVTADPVFLLEAKEWKQFARRLSLPKEYIFCYVMSENDSLKACVEYLQHTKKMPVIIRQTCRHQLKINGKKINTLGPDEFLFLLSHANYVVTNSFHGCALSSIFRKKFFCLQEEKFLDDKRYEAMMYYGQVTGKIVPIQADWQNFDFSAYLIDGNKAYDNMMDWIKQSKEFLIKHVQNKR